MGIFNKLIKIFSGAPGSNTVNEVEVEKQVVYEQQTTPETQTAPKPKTYYAPQTMPDKLNGIPKAYHYKTVYVCIIDGKKPDFNKLNNNMPITFIPEPDNPYDNNAVIVRTENINIGYLYKGNLQQMTLDYLKRGDPIKSHITHVDIAHETVCITMGFYKVKTGRTEYDYDKLIEINAPYKIFKLTGNRNADMQEALLTCSEGEKVEYEYDDDKEKYVAVCGDDVGYFPKSSEKYLDDERSAFIYSIDEDDNEKYVVKVAVFLEN